MASILEIRKSTVDSLSMIIKYQAEKLIKNIAKYKKWTEEETQDLITKFVSDNNVELKVIAEKKRGGKKLDLSNKERCCAKVANGDRCSRRKKKNLNFCGIHNNMSQSAKGLVYGFVKDGMDESSKSSKSDKSSKSKKTIKAVIEEETDTEDIVSPQLGHYVDDSDEYSDDEEDVINTVDKVINGITYMLDPQTNDLYSSDTGGLIGKYDPNNDEIIQ